MSFVAKGKKKRIVQNQDKQTPHTVLQKLSPKPSRTLLMHKRSGQIRQNVKIQKERELMD